MDYREKVAGFTGRAAMVIAGPGSGKTSLLVNRIGCLIREYQTPPKSILAVTFTNRAANDLRRKLMEVEGDCAKGVWIGTFHSVCARIIHEQASQHLVQEFSIVDSDEALRFIRECVEVMSLPEWFARGAAEVISASKRELALTKDAFLKFCRELGGRASRASRRVLAMEECPELLWKVQHCYGQNCRAGRFLDFDDLIIRATRLFKWYPEVESYYEDRITDVLVDEFQDVSPAEYDFLLWFARPHKTVFCVGDDDQSIYGWRQAHTDLMLHKFFKDFAGAEKFLLKENRRNPPGIINAALRLVDHNKHREPKEIVPESVIESKPLWFVAEDDVSEAGEIARLIAEWRQTECRQHSDFAVLCRTRRQLDVIADALEQRNIPVSRAVRFFKLREVMNVIKLLRVAVEPCEQAALRDAAKVLGTRISDTDLERVSTYLAERLNEDRGETPRLTKHRSTKPVRSLIIAIYRLNRKISRRLSASDAITQVVRLWMKSSTLTELQLRNLAYLRDLARQFESMSLDSSPSAFMEQLQVFGDEEMPLPIDAVRLMTIHSAKGLEFPVVFVAGIEQGVVPHREAMKRRSAEETLRNMAEERRVLYVAMTRAKEKLVLSGCATRGGRHSRHSMFVEEIGSSNIETIACAGTDGRWAEMERRLLSALPELTEAGYPIERIADGTHSSSLPHPVQAVALKCSLSEPMDARRLCSKISKILGGVGSVQASNGAYRVVVNLAEPVPASVGAALAWVLGAVTGESPVLLESCDPESLVFVKGREKTVPRKVIEYLTGDKMRSVLEFAVENKEAMKSSDDGLASLLLSVWRVRRSLMSARKQLSPRSSLHKSVDYDTSKSVAFGREWIDMAASGWIYRVKEAYPADWEHRIAYRLLHGIPSEMFAWRVDVAYPVLLDRAWKGRPTGEYFNVEDSRRQCCALRNELVRIIDLFVDVTGLKLQKRTRHKLINCVCYALDRRDSAVRLKETDVIVLSQDDMIKDVEGVNNPKTHGQMMRLMVSGYDDKSVSLGVFDLVRKGANDYSKRAHGYTPATEIRLSEAYHCLLSPECECRTSGCPNILFGGIREPSAVGSDGS